MEMGNRDMKKIIQKIRKPYDEMMQNRRINKFANAIWKYALRDSLNPKYTKEDAMKLSIAILWNDADSIKEVLSYTDKNGNRVFPR